MRAALRVGAFVLAGLLASCGAAAHRAAVQHHLVGPTSTAHPVLVARLVHTALHKAPPYGLPTATVTFTVGLRGEQPGTGIPDGSVISVYASGRLPSAKTIEAYGTHGRYTATVVVPPGGLESLQVGGFLNVRRGSSLANGDYWIPVTFTERER